MQTRHLWIVGPVLLLAVMALAGAASAQEGGDPERGGELYVENCAVCHGIEGGGRIGADLQNFPGIDVSAALTQTIAAGVPGSVMPAWSEANGGPLTSQDIDDIVAYISSAFGGTAPIEPLPTYEPAVIQGTPFEAEGDPVEGSLLYQANCVMCHGETGQGRFGRPLAQAWAANEPAAYIRQVVSEGIDGTTMPAWAQARGGPLSEEAVADVTTFVLTLEASAQPAEPPEPAEGPLGRSTSLILLAAAALIVVIVVIVYYRRA